MLVLSVIRGCTTSAYKLYFMYLTGCTTNVTHFVHPSYTCMYYSFSLCTSEDVRLYFHFTACLYFVVFSNTHASKEQNVSPNGQQPVSETKQTRTVKKFTIKKIIIFNLLQYFNHNFIFIFFLQDNDLSEQMNDLPWNDSLHGAENSMRDDVEEHRLNDESADTERIVPQPDREDELVPQPESKVLFSYLCISLCNLATLVIIMSILTKPMINKIL